MGEPATIATASTGPLLVMEDLWKSYVSGSGETIPILSGAALSIDTGDSMAVVGASGIGKSTLLHVLGTLDRPDRGRIIFDGTDILSYSPSALAAFRNRAIGFVFQFHHLLPEFNALENTMMPALINGWSVNHAAQAAEEILVRVGLKDRLFHSVTRLSGGEQQRVALARALLMSPQLLLADEPTGNLDRQNSEQIHGLLAELNAERGMTLVVVTHNLALAATMSRSITIAEGQLVSPS
ncbi:MAG: ABC transporter ATP-binding protein [Pseudomonadota bacterium]